MIILVIGVPVPGLVFTSKGNNANMDRDLVLAEKIQRGDKPAFDDLFRIYYAPLCRFAWYICGSAEIAEEAVQEMFIHLWTNRKTLHIEKSVSALLYKAIRNKVLNHIKSRAVRLKYEAGYAEERVMEETDTSMSTDPEKVQKMVNRAVDKLPEKCKLVFSLSRNDGLTYDEIAEYLDISEKTVENQMTIAFKKLREELKPWWEKYLGLEKNA